MEERIEVLSGIVSKIQKDVPERLEQVKRDLAQEVSGLAEVFAQEVTGIKKSLSTVDQKLSEIGREVKSSREEVKKILRDNHIEVLQNLGKTGELLEGIENRVDLLGGKLEDQAKDIRVTIENAGKKHIEALDGVRGEVAGKLREQYMALALLSENVDSIQGSLIDLTSRLQALATELAGSIQDLQTVLFRIDNSLVQGGLDGSTRA
ncbi:hypothetical protein IG193_00505 [Infirmifilum lucidum]|uniref:Uncharacterized protein n=1 Tax=Infirmifilum lucidum TaxID=2776706 RepID=A0A7L9FHZ2_9CREN|nr:hypothetical protein [Infirmifilum lucidum]QOJ78982.1 hypothetical protein IG193_00505 [Infirmifilum lucidum]